MRGVGQVEAKVHAGHDKPAVKEPGGEQELAAAVPPAPASARGGDDVQDAEKVRAELAGRFEYHPLLDGHLIIRGLVPRVIEGTRAHAVAHRRMSIFLAATGRARQNTRFAVAIYYFYEVCVSIFSFAEQKRGASSSGGQTRGWVAPSFPRLSHSNAFRDGRAACSTVDRYLSTV